MDEELTTPSAGLAEGEEIAASPPEVEAEPEQEEMTSSAGLVEGEEIAVPLPQAEAKPEQEVEPEEEEAQVPEGTRWYVVHTYSGYENKVKRNLDQRIRYLGVADQIFDIIVPTEEEIEIKEGQRRTVQRKIFPGYILVQMLLSDDTWHVVRHTPGVTGFVGPGSEPVSLPEHEVQAILKQMEAEAPKIRVEFTVGQAVRIVDGPFADFEGVVDEINQEKGKVRVLVSFFGRETPIELDFMQIERLVP